MRSGILRGLTREPARCRGIHQPGWDGNLRLGVFPGGGAFIEARSANPPDSGGFNPGGA